MKAPFADYLLRRIDRPLAWVLVFGCCLTVALAMVGYSEDGLRGAFEGGIAGLIVGVLAGFVFGGVVWLGCRLIQFDRPVRRPDRWALPLRCTRCEYQTTPEGPWRIRDCMLWPEKCPLCEGSLVLLKPICPRCGGGGLSGENTLRDLSLRVRRPRSLAQALWGGYRCKECNCDYDKWGREVPG